MYFHSERGRDAGLTANRRALCRLLWRLWSPTWAFDDAIFARSAGAFDNPDFVDVVIHSYRHRFGGIAGDPTLDAIEARLALGGHRVPACCKAGTTASILPSVDDDARHFTGTTVSPPGLCRGSAGGVRRSRAHEKRGAIAGGPVRSRSLPHDGAPAAFAEAVLSLP